MAEVLHRQAEDEVRLADPRLKRATTSSDGSIQDEGLHKIVAVGGGAAGLELVTRLGHRLGRRSRARVTWWNAPGHISGSHCCTKWRRAALIPANTR